MPEHLTKLEDGRVTFKSDKYPWCEADFVPLKITDPYARDLLWQYAERKELEDDEFAQDLRVALESWEPSTHDCGDEECPVHHGGNAPYCLEDPKA